MTELIFADTAEVLNKQQEQLTQVVQYVNTHSAFYKRLFVSNNIQVEKIKSIDDFKQIPFTTKEDIQKHNDDFVCVTRNKIIDYVTTSGTLGEPVTIALTENDLERLALNECNSFKIAGGSSKDVYQLMTTIDKRFMAGLAYFLGARKLGAGIIRVGNGIPQLQWDTINRIKPNIIVCVPSFILKLIEYAKQHNIDYKNSSIQKAICIGEPIRNEDFSLNTLGKKITENWNLQLFSTYASSEMAAAFTECEHGVGGHLQPELLYIELIDENGNQVKEGEAGELVVTTLGVEAMPLLRFKTGDVCKIHYEKCKCGRTSPRLSPILGRKKQMIKYKGTTIYPHALYEILDVLDEVKNYQIEVFTNEIGTDELLVHIGCVSPSEKLEKEIKDFFRAKLRVAPSVIFTNAEKLQQLLFPETSRKPIKFIDKRLS
ncbi:MAG TPA: AMP-binding protein [Bacteroidia bacterium]|nr:AMP-binding protein [Bacteroidia bacterium]